MFEGEEFVYDALEEDSAYRKRRARRDLDQLPFGAGFYNANYEPGDMLKAGEVHGFISVPIPFSARAQMDSSVRWFPNLVMEEVLEKRSYAFCYCSVYDEECEQTHLGADPPEAGVCEF